MTNRDEVLNGHLDFLFGRGNWHSGKVSLNYTQIGDLIDEVLAVGRREGKQMQIRTDVNRILQFWQDLAMKHGIEESTIMGLELAKIISEQMEKV